MSTMPKLNKFFKPTVLNCSAQDPTADILERFENAKGIPELPISLCTEAVSGTGNIVNAELFGVATEALR